MELAAGDRSWLTSIRKSRMSDDRAFEWDDAKAASNFAKHRIRFEVAVRVFSDRAQAALDASRAADGEVRRKAVGLIEGRLFTVVYTERHGVVRIISARRSNAKERRAYASVYP
jgi:uncharacterized protein